MTPEIDKTVSRFNDVIEARTSIAELIGLFDKLVHSDKFEEKHKPWCFLRLIEVVALRVVDEKIAHVMQAIERSGAGKSIQQVIPYDQSEAQLGIFVRRYIGITPINEDALFKAFDRLATVRIALNRLDVICMLIAAKEDSELVDTICDLTAARYYGLPAKVTPKSTPEIAALAGDAELI